ncbi:Nitrile-specifier protein 5 [Thelohanellus kitauei]|uniref:Nitrile-specifier protein 5 n=1 Tax=Thelohanellus kitauei TaxID=669202 RepID=A0A0C2JAK2_THEKT|nr:Nitrile-specifier protein 5 [Thelohanellus kitauei]
MNQQNEHMRPSNRVHHCMTSVREFVIIYGGYENFNGVECNDLWTYNTITGIWKRHQLEREIKDTCLSSSICSVGNLVYIFGGDCIDGENYRQTNSIISFDITNATWDVVSPHIDNYHQNMPPPLCGNLLLHHNGWLYVIGGFNDSLNINTIYKFCLKSSTWSLMPQNGVKPTFNRQIFGTVYKNR